MTIELIKDILLILGLTEFTIFVLFFLGGCFVLVKAKDRSEEGLKESSPTLLAILTFLADISVNIALIAVFLLLVEMWMHGLASL